MRARPALGRVVALALVAVIAAAGCGTLGWWQWTRAYERSHVLIAEPTVPIADLLAPASAPEQAVGNNVTVSGTWGPGAAVAFGREIDGIGAALLVREFIVDADETGTGAPATLAVLIGWRVESEATAPSTLAGVAATLDGYLRTSEAPTPGDGAVPTVGIGTAIPVLAVSAAELAQVWGTPMYAAVLVAPDGTNEWDALPAREPTSQLNLQSAAYAIEWWIFGLFAVVLAVRAMRDNGRNSPQEDT